MFKGSKKAQSVLEYVVVLGAIVGIILFAAKTWIGPGVNTGITNAASAIDSAAGKIP